ncbi:MAG TPA: class I SAM-dependent methyltransferase [Solirubrobacteraceae bacterium]|jgi:SAM-dependent methyltransferase
MSPPSDASGEEPRLIEWTGERCVPWVADVAMLYEHFHRYLWVRPLVAGRTVLDLGSGEGFGAAILASSAERVVGVDVDADAVEHAARKYAGERLRFQRASALDLSEFAEGSFGVVVAFEVIEHVDDHQRVLAEVDRVLAHDGLLVISTPDRDAYREASGHVNRFHEHELTIAEFRELLLGRFEHVSTWGQRTITGSYLHALEDTAGDGGSSQAQGLFVKRSADGIEVEHPLPIFCVAVASRTALPAVPVSSTLADAHLELVEETARAYASSVAERDALLGEVHEELNEANRTLEQKRAEALALGDELVELRHELQLIEESVSWQALQRAKTAMRRLLDEQSPLARSLSASLRLLGRLLSGSR